MKLNALLRIPPTSAITDVRRGPVVTFARVEGKAYKLWTRRCRYLINLSAGDRRAEAARVGLWPCSKPLSILAIGCSSACRIVPACTPAPSPPRRNRRLQVRHAERQRSLSIRSSFRARRPSLRGTGDCGNPVGQSRGSITRIDDY